ncbi:MAG: hypothetical protein ACREP9_00980 [Candidatus Dormibacteraceae bacterium]
MPTLHPDWMNECRDALTNLPLCQIPMPGSHDAGSFGPINTQSKTQEYSIKGQLMYGVRYFDFRVKVDNGQFFAHHGLDDARHNPYAQYPVEIPKSNGEIFYEISEFCNDHPGEVVIVNFTDFTAVARQSFNDDDKRHFMERMRAIFGKKMVRRKELWKDDKGQPVYGNDIPTYGDCMNNGWKILVLINENDVPVWRAHPDIWPTIGCWRDRFSAVKYATNSKEEMVRKTMEDQQEYLTTAHAEDGRDRTMFWVSQTILDYPAYEAGGKSRNYWGAETLNPEFVTAYEKWWNGKSATGIPSLVKQPNILLFDFCADFEDFPTTCKKLVKG